MCILKWDWGSVYDFFATIKEIWPEFLYFLGLPSCSSGCRYELAFHKVLINHLGWCNWFKYPFSCTSGSVRHWCNIDSEGGLCMCPDGSVSFQWRHNEYVGVSNHQPHDCLLNRLFRRRLKKTSKLRVTGLCAGKSPVTGEFSARSASNAENVSIW